jgi:hypothetical protein
VNTEAIIRVDEIAVTPGGRDEFVDLLRSRYVPAAEGSGLVLVEIGSVTDAADPDVDVVVTWRLADVDAFWHARRGAMTDPGVTAFWDESAHLVTKRTRRYEQPSPAAIEDEPAAALPDGGVHHIVLLHLTDDAEPQLDAPGVRKASLGRHLPGSIGPHASWEFDAEEPIGSDAFSVSGATVTDVVVLGDVIGGGARAPRLRDGIKRTLLLTVNKRASRDSLAAFERDLLEMPRHIQAIRNWRLACVANSHGGWTHAWEQEYAELSGLRDDYMRNPFHWGVVDGWFDSEDPRCIVAPELLHVFYESASSILA